MYETRTALINDALVSCSCNCQAGSIGNDGQSVCVHNLPLVFLYVILLTNGLAQNILIEFANRWSMNLEKKMIDCQQIESIKHSLLTLMSADGHDVGNNEQAYSVTDILEKFSVGTQKAKVFLPRPKDEELKPLRLINFQSNNKQGERACVPRLKKGRGVAKNSSTTIQLPSAPTDTPTEMPINRPTEMPTDTPSNPVPLPIATDILPINHETTATPVTILKKNKYNTLDSVICNVCKIPGRLTNHTCTYPITKGKFKIEGTEESICGTFFCVLCRIGEENRTRCPCHVPGGSSVENTIPSSNPTNIPKDLPSTNSHTTPTAEPSADPTNDIAPFQPNYSLVKRCIDALDDDKIKSRIYHRASDMYYLAEQDRLSDIAGYNLLEMRAKKEARFVTAPIRPISKVKDLRQKEKGKKEMCEKWNDAFKAQTMRKSIYHRKERKNAIESSTSSTSTTSSKSSTSATS